MNREAIYTALWQKLAAIDGFATKSRKLRHWHDVNRHDQPALFMAQGNQQAITSTGQNSKWLLMADVYVYVHTAGEAPAPILNPLLDAICNAVNEIHPITGKSTLAVDDDNTVIEYCRVEGTIETDEGTLGEQAVAIIPIAILVA